jgi:tRNA A37 threonylcarbamoyltransferase TsaD
MPGSLPIEYFAHEGLNTKARSCDMLDTLVPSAREFAQKIAIAEAEEAAKDSKARHQAELDKKALLDQLTNPSGVSDEEAIQRALKMIENAARNRLKEVQVYRFPNQLCTDNGRAINQMEAGWSETLTGIPKEIYQLWDRHFREKGYKLRAEIVDFPNGMPGDVALTLVWV